MWWAWPPSVWRGYAGDSSKIGGEDENNAIPTQAWQVFKPRASTNANLTDPSGRDHKNIQVYIHLNMRNKYAWEEKKL